MHECAYTLPPMSTIHHATGQPHPVWKYNTLQHIVLEHMIPGENGGHLPLIPPEMMVDTYIPRAEEKTLGIEEELTEDWRDKYEIPGSDDIAGMRESLDTAAKGRKKKRRDRAQSAVAAEPQNKSRRTR